MSKEAKIDEITELKAKIASLVANIRDARAVCTKYDRDNDYLQDYVGSVMKSGDL